MSNNINSIKAAITDNLGSLRSGTSPAQIERVATAILNRGNKSVRQTINDEVGYIPSTYSNVIDDIVAAIEALEGKAVETSPEAGVKSIKHTIGEALPTIHIPADYYTKVVDALTEREYEIADGLLSAASVNFPSISENTIKGIVAGAGLTFRPEPVVEVVPEPEVAPEAEDATAPEAAEDATFREDRRDAETEAVTLDSNDGVVGEVATGKSDADRLRKLEKQVKKLTKLAKRHLSF